MIKIDTETCEACGICGHVCPRHIPEIVESEGKKINAVSPERAALCMDCGQCAAVCPTSSISVEGLDPDEFAPVTDLDISENVLLTLMTQRRSVRRYRDKPVPRDVVDRIIESARWAPTGTSRRTTGIIVVDRPEILKALSKPIYEMYDDLDKALKNPIARFFIKRKVGPKRLSTLQNFVMPGMRWYSWWYRHNRGNEILRDCPALMLFHAPVMEPSGEANCVIAAFQAILMAEVLGVGTCFNDLIPPACNRVAEIRNMLDLPEDREVYSCLTLGYAKYRFKRIIPRKLAEVRYLA